MPIFAIPFLIGSLQSTRKRVFSDGKKRHTHNFLTWPLRNLIGPEDHFSEYKYIVRAVVQNNYVYFFLLPKSQPKELTNKSKVSWPKKKLKDSKVYFPFVLHLLIIFFFNSFYNLGENIKCTLIFL